MNNQQSFQMQRSHSGPLTHHLETFAAALFRQGYAAVTAKIKIRVASAFDQWLQKRHVAIENVNESYVDKFIRYRQRRGRLRSGDQLALRQLIAILREEGVLSAFISEVSVSEIDRSQHRFAQYLRRERGLSEATIDNYLSEIRRFLAERFRRRKINFKALRAHDISTHVLRRARAVSAGRAKTMVNALRSYFRFLHQHRETAIDLSVAVPKVAGWKFSEVPKFLQPTQVKQLLKSCDRSTSTGKRNYAILLLLSRLGLRAGEIVHMELDDILWETSELIVKGKNNREEKLPLPHDVGKAIVTYLRDVRPRCASRRLFIKMVAPLGGFSSSVTVCTIVRDSLARAGINIAFKGAHLFRHTLATNMLRGGASITEIGEILRHQDPNATEIYAKVDLASLRALAQPWPGGRL